MTRYKILRKVNIRKGAEIVQNAKGTNIVGLFQVGDIVEVYDTQTDGNRRTWGRVSEADPTGKANYFCIKELNGEYAKEIQAEPEDRLAKLEAWARTKGYNG